MPNKLISKIILAGIFLLILNCGFAEGIDVLSGTTGDITATIGSSGKKWLYLMEGMASIFAYIKTKNVFVLGGIAVVAFMVNIILHLAGN